MDFFTSQDEARKKTGTLIVYFALAVVAIIAALYVVGVLIMGYVQAQDVEHPSFALQWWNPKLLLGVGGGTLLLVGLSSAFKIAQLRGGGGVVAQSLGGVRIEPYTQKAVERQLLNVVEEMALASGTRVPEVYVIPGEGINAFAAGYTADDAAIGVTRGCMERLSRDELQGVIAHEFSHILNGDMRLNIRLMGVLFGILVLAVAGGSILRAFSRVRISGSSRSRGSKDGGGAGIILIIMLVALTLWVVGYIGVFFGRLIQSAISRQREFLADAAAVQFTRNPEGIANALKRIGGSNGDSLVDNPHTQETAHLFFANALKRNLGGMFATHPPLEQRITRIDPGWDGKYIYHRREHFSRKESEPGTDTKPPEAQHVTPEPIGVPARRTLQPHEMLLAAGTLQAAALEDARQLRASIDADFALQIRGPLEARSLIFALILDTKVDERGKQLAYLKQEAGEELVEKVLELRKRIELRERGEYLAIVELALPALAEMEPERREVFQARLRKLARMDKAVSPLEFVIMRMVKQHLAVSPRDKRQQWNVIYSYSVLAEPMSLVLSVFVRLTVQSEGQAEACFQRASEKLVPLVREKVRLLPPEKIDIDALDAAMDKLGNAAYGVRKSLLEAAAEVVSYDGETSPREAEMFRVLALALDCPMPLLPRT